MSVFVCNSVMVCYLVLNRMLRDFIKGGFVFFFFF